LNCAIVTAMEKRSPYSPYYIDWAITSSCNLRCAHCRGMPVDQLPTPRILSLLDEIRTLNPGWILIEGGEPLLREDLLPIMEHARELDQRVFLITNGMLVTKDVVRQFSRLRIDTMISIDSPDRRTFETLRGGANFSRVVHAAAQCAENGILDAINFTLSRQNLRQIPDLFKLAKTIGATRINILGLKPCENYSKKLLTPAEYRLAIELCCRMSLATGLCFFFDEPFFKSAVREWGLEYYTEEKGSSITIGNEPGCILGKYLFITPDGDVWPCSFSPYVVGNVRGESLIDAWNKMPRIEFIQNLMNPRSRKEACSRCRYITECSGCRARTYNLTGDWFEADPACPLRSNR
jgi:radical SAM protein with 4Fe4S-binding SPASM domain